MKALFIVLNKTEKLEDLLQEFSRQGIYGATILESQGMAQTLIQSQDVSGIYMGIASMLNQGRPFNKTIFMVMDENRLALAKQVIAKVLGDLNTENIGIYFTVPVDSWEGIRSLAED